MGNQIQYSKNERQNLILTILFIYYVINSQNTLSNLIFCIYTFVHKFIIQIIQLFNCIFIMDNPQFINKNVFLHYLKGFYLLVFIVFSIFLDYVLYLIKIHKIRLIKLNNKLLNLKEWDNYNEHI